MRYLHGQVIYFMKNNFGILLSKVEKILKGSLDLIPSPSVKIQVIGGKIYLK